jgi:hypothetical protein
VGKTQAVKAWTWVQGEQDDSDGTSNSAYIALFTVLFNSIAADAATLTGQHVPPICIMYQTCANLFSRQPLPLTAQAQLTICTDPVNRIPGCYMAAPCYIFPNQGYGNPHLTATGYKWMGAYFGLVYKRVVIDGLDWLPLLYVDYVRSGNSVLIRFNKTGLQWDTTIVAMNTNYGFDVVDTSGNVVSQLSVPTIINGNCVKITASEPILAGFSIEYAFRTNSTHTPTTDLSGPVFGPRGNLRDNQGATLVFDPSGINEPMHNWCPMFKLVLA